MRTHCRLGSDGVSVRKPESLFRCRIRNSWLVRNLNRARFLVSGPKDLRESLVRRNTNDGLGVNPLQHQERFGQDNCYKLHESPWLPRRRNPAGCCDGLPPVSREGEAPAELAGPANAATTKQSEPGRRWY